VRRYLIGRLKYLNFSGSAWSEYKKSGTVHGMRLPEGLVESEKLAEPLFTPSTKAEQGAHDENISPERGLNSSESLRRVKSSQIY
jgi:phosphoribosylaminoimidazole-succinocarboxamide synthase